MSLLPDYDSDGLIVYNKNLGFLSDSKFMNAYKIGIHSGHKIGGGGDLHIEWRIHVCCWAAYHAKHLEGDFVECGTNTGIMSLAVMNYIDFNSTNKNFYLFDTFQGIPKEQITDEEKALGRVEETDNFYPDCYEISKKNFSPFPNAHLVRGKVPDTLTSVNIEKLCYLCIDMNIVIPEIAAMEFFWDKLIPGAPVILDDYAWKAYYKQKEAFDEFAQKKDINILTLPTGQGLIIKP